MYSNAEEFGKRMQKVRCENHLTQEQLADLLNISRIHVARIERGARTCSIDLLVEIADALHIAFKVCVVDKIAVGLSVLRNEHIEVVH